MGSFTNHRSIEKTTLTVLQPDGSLPQIDAFYKDIYRLNLSIDSVPCLAPNEILIPDENKETNKEESQGIKSSKALFDYFFKKYTIESSDKQYYENFIKLFLNQLYYGIPTMTCSYQLMGSDINAIVTDFNVDLKLNKNNLFLSISYSFLKQDFKLADHEKEIILKGKTMFKIEVNQKNEKKWVAKFGLVDSIIDCKNEYKNILDSRNFLEKLIDFFTSIIKYTTSRINSEIPLESKIKSTPLFFASEDGESMKIVNSTNELSKTLTQ